MSDERHQIREGAPLGSLDLSPSLAQLGRNLDEAERLVDLGLGASGDQGAVVDAEQPVLVQFEPARHCAIAQGDIVRLRPGEILHRGSVTLLWNEPQIGLNAAPQQDARLGFSLAENPIDELVHGEGGHDVRICPGCENVDVSGRVGAAADAADRHERHRRALGAQVVEQQRGRLGGVGQEMSSGMLLPLGAGLENELLLLRAQALQLADPAVAARRLELVDRADAELRKQLGNGFRSDALKMKKVQNRRGELLEQVAMIASLAGFGDLADLRGELLADAGNGAELVFGAVRETLGCVCDCVGRIPVRADLERVLALDLEEVGNLREDARDGEVFHDREQEMRRS